MTRLVPRVVIAGMSGDSGKTLVSLALLLASRERGMAVRAFKKGPDYIDAAWLAWASGAPTRNLDTFLAGFDGVSQAFSRHAVQTTGEATGAGLNVIEGNRGLFDGMDAEGTHSTAALAKLLEAPVVLVLNARKMTGTAAALVRGCQALDPDVRIAAVVLNQVAGRRHEAVAREAIERASGVPVVGAIPRLDENVLPGRHLGLVTPLEHPGIDRVADALRDITQRCLDIDGLLSHAANHSGSDFRLAAANHSRSDFTSRAVTIGYLSDSAFSFYYPDNLEALEAQGATLVPWSSLSGNPLPPGLDALYIGGGFPETHASALEGNRALGESLRAAATEGLPIYAECGGLMLLANVVTWQGRRHAMAGVLPIDVEVCAVPQGHGYVVLGVDQPNPFFAVGREIRGHEFHYSRITGPVPDTACEVCRGTGCGGGRDAIVANNVWASYTHVHAAGMPDWAEGLVAAARRYQQHRRPSNQA